ncbi:MAG TPA: hypothetical protein VF791_18500 [Pyrinomonadaceae bacterium]
MNDFQDWQPEVHVLIPFTLAQGIAVSPSYDTTEFRAEIKDWFEPLGLKWRWQPVMLETCAQVLSELKRKSRTQPLVAFNLCDGAETDGYPGLTVVRTLEELRLPYTGADSAFYELTTSKMAAKERFKAAGVPTAPYFKIENPALDIPRGAEEIGFPLLIKPDVSAASFGIGLRSRVYDVDSAITQAQAVLKGKYELAPSPHGLFAERFVVGPEFTALVVADHTSPGISNNARAYPVVERTFHSSLPPEERFLSYGRYWEDFEEETQLSTDEYFYNYRTAQEELQERLQETARRAFSAVGGTGYARVDMRLDEAAKELYVLEVNSNCGLSNDAYSSIGMILKACGQPMHGLVAEILRDAFVRAESTKKLVKEKTYG